MRRLGVLLVLLAVMLGVRVLKTEPTAAGHPLTLAAIGFVLLAAFTIAEIGSAFSLPRVTGYIVAGAVLGPSVADVLSRGVVVEMQMFNTLAIGLIAVAAGLELDALQIARLWRTLTVTVLVKVLLGVVLVGGTLYAWEMGFGSLGLPTADAVLGIALVFGMLSLGTSPSIALAVTSELRSRGRISDLVLGAAVLKDLVVVVGLAVVLAVSQDLVGDGSGAAGSIVGGVARELGASVAVGAVLGVGLIAYLRYVRAEMLLFVAAMILVTAELTHHWHLELLLVFITAGFVVRNFSRFEHELMQPVQLAALPVFVVFFTNAGASIDFSGTWRLLPVAIALAAARAITYVVASRIGGRAGRESEVVTRSAWLGYLPQAGVTLGLVRLAADKLPSVAEAIMTLGMVVVAVNLLVGPIALRLALRRAGEVPSDSRETQGTGPGSFPDSADGVESATVAEVIGGIEDSRIRTLASKIASDLGRLAAGLVEGHVGQWARGLRVELAHLEESDQPDLEGLAVWALRDAPSLSTDRAHAGAEFFRRVRSRLRRLPEVASFPFTEQHWQPRRSDGVGLAWKKRRLRLRLWFYHEQRRRVPVMTAARLALEGRLARACLTTAREWNVTEASVLADLERLALGELGSGEAAGRIRERLADLERLALGELERSMARGFAEFVSIMVAAGTPALPTSRLRFSRTETDVRAALSALETEGAAWASALAGARFAVHVAARLGAVRRVMHSELQASIISPMTSAVESSAAVLLQVHEVLSRIERELQEQVADDDARRAEMLARVRAAFDQRVWQTLERDAARFRSGVSTHALALQVRDAMEGLPAQIQIGDARALAMSGRPDGVGLASVRVAQLFSDALLHDLLPGIDEEVRRAAGTLVNLTQRLREAEEIASLAFELAESEGPVDAGLGEALRRATGKLQEQASALRASSQSASGGMQERLSVTFDSLAAALLEPARAEILGNRALFQRLHRSLREAWGILRRSWHGLDSAARRIGHSDVSRDILSLYRKTNLDAATLRGHVRRHTERTDLPPAYVKLFALEPLAGPRLFTAYRGELGGLVTAERGWLDGGPSSALIVGAHGSGRSSMLSQCKVELSAPRMLRLETLQWRRELGLVGALAVTLGVRPSMGALVRSLSSTKTTVIVDDLEHWLTPDLQGLAELERFLDIVVRTSDQVFWIVAAEAGAYALFEEVMPVSYAFGTTVRLEPLGAAEIRTAIEARHALSGFVLRHEPGPLSAIRNRIPGLRDEEVVYKMLAGLSEGNLARAIALYLRSITLRDNGELELGVGRLIHATLPVAGWLQARDQALLTQLLRFGPLKTGQLSSVLGLPRADITRQLGFLRATGLIVGGGVERDPARVPPELRPVVTQGLRVFQVKS